MPGTSILELAWISGVKAARMDKELTDRAEAILRRIVQLRDSL